MVWEFDRNEDDLDYVIEYFERGKSENGFFPAEFIDVQVPKNKKRLDRIFCEYIQEIGPE